MKVLVVDDDSFAGEMIAAVVEEMQYDVHLVENAIDALEAIETTPDFDLIISDMNMPMVSGIELFQNLKEAGKTYPFILLTGDDPEPLKLQEPELSACILKDFSMDEILPPIITQVLVAGGKL